MTLHDASSSDAVYSTETCPSSSVKPPSESTSPQVPSVSSVPLTRTTTRSSSTGSPSSSVIVIVIVEVDVPSAGSSDGAAVTRVVYGSGSRCVGAEAPVGWNALATQPWPTPNFANVALLKVRCV